MEWVDLLTNEDLKPKVEVAGMSDQLSIRIGRSVSDQFGWAPGTAKLQFADEKGRAYVRIAPNPTADWWLQSAGKGGGLTISAVQLAPSEVFASTMCVCELAADGSAVVSLPSGFKLASQEMLKRRKLGKAHITKSSSTDA